LPRAASGAISCGPRSLPACGSIATTSTPPRAARASTIVERPRNEPISTMRPGSDTREAASHRRLAWASVIQPSTSRTSASVTSKLGGAVSVLMRRPPAAAPSPGRRAVEVLRLDRPWAVERLLLTLRAHGRDIGRRARGPRLQDRQVGGRRAVPGEGPRAALGAAPSRSSSSRRSTSSRTRRLSSSTLWAARRSRRPGPTRAGRRSAIAALGVPHSAASMTVSDQPSDDEAVSETQARA
jgi:hypothetical protein